MADGKGLEERLAWGVRQEVLRKDRKGHPKKYGSLSFTIYPGNPDSISDLLSAILSEINYGRGGIARYETVESKHPYNLYYTTNSRGEIPFAKVIPGDVSTVYIDTKMMGLAPEDLTPETIEAVLTKKGFAVSKEFPIHIRRVYDQGFTPQILEKQIYYVRGQHVIDKDGNVIKDDTIRKQLGLKPYEEPSEKDKRSRFV